MNAVEKFEKAKKIQEEINSYVDELKAINDGSTMVCLKSPTQRHNMGKVTPLVNNAWWLKEIKERTESKIIELRIEFDKLMK